MTNRFYSERHHELKDDQIVKALRKAADDYENGELSEVQDLMYEIVDAIQQFYNREVHESNRDNKVYQDLNRALQED